MWRCALKTRWGAARLCGAARSIVPFLNFLEHEWHGVATDGGSEEAEEQRRAEKKKKEGKKEGKKVKGGRNWPRKDKHDGGGAVQEHRHAQDWRRAPVCGDVHADGHQQGDRDAPVREGEEHRERVDELGAIDRPVHYVLRHPERGVRPQCAVLCVGRPACVRPEHDPRTVVGAAAHVEQAPGEVRVGGGRCFADHLQHDGEHRLRDLAGPGRAELAPELLVPPQLQLQPLDAQHPAPHDGRHLEQAAPLDLRPDPLGDPGARLALKLDGRHVLHEGPPRGHGRQDGREPRHPGLLGQRLQDRAGDQVSRPPSG